MGYVVSSGKKNVHRKKKNEDVKCKENDAWILISYYASRGRRYWR